MRPLIDRPIVCPVLVGRDLPLAALNGVIDEIRHEGRGRTVLISGEAGIGKSRLVREAGQAALRLDMSLLQGNAFAHDRAVPYAPLLDLLRSYLGGHPLSELVASDPGALARLLPELAPAEPDRAAGPELEPALAQHRLFHALADLLIRLTATRSVVMVIEDAHWSDETSLDFLLFLSRRLVHHPLLLLVTYRDDEGNASLSQFLANLDRERLAQEISLTRLGRPEVDAMLRATLGLDRPLPHEMLDTMHTLTDGNPFFVEEVLKALVAEGDVRQLDDTWVWRPVAELRIPRSVQAVVHRRLERLSPEARQVIVLAAVAGRRFDFELLKALTGLDEPGLMRSIKELSAAQLVVEESADRYIFRHALTQQAIYAMLLQRERRAWHREIAAAIERLDAGALDYRLADLAEHCYRAEAWAKTLDYTQRMGDMAQTLHTPRAAIVSFNRAIEAASHLAVRPPSSLYRARGHAYATVGETERAHEDYQLALHAAREEADGPAECQALIDLGFLCSASDYARAGDYFRRALALARRLGDPALLARCLNRLGNWHLNTAQPEMAPRHHAEALALFERMHDRLGIAESLDLLAMATALEGDLSLAMTYGMRAAGLFRELDRRQELALSLAAVRCACSNYETETVVASPMSLADSLRLGEESLVLARDLGSGAIEAYTQSHMVFCLGAHGEYGRAWDLGCRALALAAEIGHRQWIIAGHCALGRLHLDWLALSPANDHLAEALALARTSGSTIWIREATAFLAMVQIARGELAAAASLIGEIAGNMRNIHLRMIWCARAELALARGQPDDALQIADRLIATAPHAETTGLGALPRLAKLRGDALHRLQRLDEAESALTTARDGAETLELWPLCWRIHLALGKLYRVQRRYEAADRELTAARALIDRLAGQISDLPLRENFLRSAAFLLPALRPVPTRRAAKSAFGGLTEREREVATLIAQGQSNRAIADALVIGEATVATHVSNILGKLGFTSRLQIAAWAIDRGLGDQTDPAKSP